MASTEMMARTEVGWTREKIDLIKQTVAKGCTDLEFQLFMHACQRTGLDPLAKQIHAIKRWDSRLGREAMSIQTGIDGYRLIAERTGHYAPGAKPTYTYGSDGTMLSSTASIKKLTEDGTWHIVEAEAFYDEYVQTTKSGEVTSMWKKPHMMLGKCAEALALRKAFPAELSGVYTHEEMMQADHDEKHGRLPSSVPPTGEPEVSGEVSASPSPDASPSEKEQWTHHLRDASDPVQLNALWKEMPNGPMKQELYVVYNQAMAAFKKKK